METRYYCVVDELLSIHDFCVIAFQTCSLLMFFFFQAEAGIRVRDVPGFQPCVLPFFSVCSCFSLVKRLHPFKQIFLFFLVDQVGYG